MQLSLGFMLEQGHVTTFVLILGAALAITCLKIIGREIEDIERWNRLQAEVRILRQKQSDRLKAMGVIKRQ